MAQISLENHCKWCGVAVTPCVSGGMQAVDGSTFCTTGPYSGTPHAGNVNCLEGYRCPNCRLSTSFDVAAHRMVIVADGGLDDHPGGETTWEANDYMMCRDCEHEGIVDDFTVKAPDLTDPSNIEAFLAEL